MANVTTHWGRTSVAAKKAIQTKRMKALAARMMTNVCSELSTVTQTLTVPILKAVTNVDVGKDSPEMEPFVGTLTNV